MKSVLPGNGEEFVKDVHAIHFGLHALPLAGSPRTKRRTRKAEFLTSSHGNMYFPFRKLWYKRPFSEYFSGSPGGSAAGCGGAKGILVIAQVSFVFLISSGSDMVKACL